ncbi:thermonuclease family protein [Microvirga tunisiensis]|uniref:Thermonuclease family protein n=1 Tax=Pannonibacter tanglangensis TaxID=2750084 RepID=A0A7X5F2G6_9HYPH|nr:thermonuclease family protein [Pannonibacter sp. XCT-53]NBN78521.1 thermonuclease family protein [Pannonibacter sp. XCT-53]
MMMNLKVIRAAALVGAGLLLVVPGHASGAGHTVAPARVIDGDTLDVGGERLRLEGIDAPELAQTCRRPDGRSYACGKVAAEALARLVAAGPLRCSGDTQDGYGRRLATCEAAGRNINAAMVLNGHAFAFTRYSASYVAEEAAARAARTGLFAGTAEAPWDYRARKWAAAGDGAAAETGPGDCRIKGNISPSGRIYHMPWSPAYGRTRIDLRRGERWFCSEAEALSAGWRAPR